MRSVAPRVGDLPEVTLAEDQHEYLTLTAAVVEYGDGQRAWLTRWRLTEVEKERVWSGDDVYLLVLGQRMAPVALSIGVPANLTPESETGDEP